MNQYRIRARSSWQPDLHSGFIWDDRFPEAELREEGDHEDDDIGGIPVAIMSSDRKRFRLIRGETEYSVTLLFDMLGAVIDQRRYWKSREKVALAIGIIAAKNGLSINVSRRNLRARVRRRGITFNEYAEEITRAHETLALEVQGTTTYGGRRS